MAEEKKVKTAAPVIDAQAMVNELVEKADKALEEYMKLTQEQVDAITQAMALAGLSAQMKLAQMAVEETGRGVFEDKVTKNIFATEYIYHSIKHDKTVGIIEDNDDEGYTEIAEPVGIVCGVTPTTNPTSTAMFKAIICAKTRNPIIFGFHPSAQNCSREAAKIVRDAAIAAGAPENCVQWIDHPSIEATTALMNHPKVAMILATGGSAMVRSAYSAGKPALGVGPGNVPAFIEKTANLEQSLTDLMLSKAFDNGMICASEQAAIIEAPIYDKAVAFMKKFGCYFATKEEIKKLEPIVINPEKQMVNPDIVGKYPYEIAALAGITIPKETKVLCCEIDGVGEAYPLSREKLSPVLAVVKAKDVEDGISKAEAMVELGGLGHTAVIHSTNEKLVEEYGERLKACRIIVNSPSAFGGIGDVYNSMMPSLTLGCGSYGRNSTSSNVTAMNLINKKRVAKRRVNMQWFKIPEKIYFEAGSVQYLAKMPNISRALIVADPMMVKL
ncbi:MAG: aldehyde dehydrogenase family protein, partial [Niameybacter sp.]|nr:aldehyde dehydrogenase family protein [Niameybacter sp.]